MFWESSIDVGVLRSGSCSIIYKIRMFMNNHGNNGEATLLLEKHLGIELCVVLMIMNLHHVTILGKNNIKLKILIQRTNIFPDAEDTNIPHMSSKDIAIRCHLYQYKLQVIISSIPR